MRVEPKVKQPAPSSDSHSFRLYRRVFPPLLDGGTWAVSLLAATWLRLQIVDTRVLTGRLLELLGLAVSAQLALGYATVLYRVRWRIGSFEEISSLAWAVTMTTIVVLVVDVLALSHAAPVGAVLAAGAFTFILTAGLRSGWRVAGERRLRPPDQAERAIIFGAGRGGHQIIDALLHNLDSPLLPVALLDDDPTKRISRIRHLRVAGGREAIAKVAVSSRAAVLLVAIPSAGSDLIRDLSSRAVASGLSLRVLPPVADLLVASTVSVGDIRSTTEEDLLGRRVIDTEVASIASYLQDRRVLVTGAGGSIGSELCRQIHKFAPASLVMLDRDESGLHQVQLSIEGRALLDTRSLVVCDIRDRAALEAVFAEHRPEVVFHAAALKHLPLLEMWPTEAIKTNVFGTQNVLNAATRVGVGRFVNVSTDKAASPQSVLGYSKRIAERLTAAVEVAHGEAMYLSVRFGNVLGSRGSVLTAFRTQIDAGGPVTVTDPDVTRYFMTIEEAVQLVIQAGAIGRSGDVLVLDMGEPVRIADLARQLVAQAPAPIEIVYTGLRPGEKLHEDLFGPGEEGAQPIHPMISHVAVPPVSFSAIRDLLNCQGDDVAAALRLAATGPGRFEVSTPTTTSSGW
ncbi:polysaccharide biosynthesis protein [Acidiferrimicrobium sp. IK]|uniref:polysaccharide biosynthesis protein n=1 Tax=Acidiferrimicrobium sp. IK TaxID=2871700 RepID=UPI0021CB2F3D|nr:nucleoside-diphosphate sugar epimerase/dehydratase [Acidiferrimicrobium sp. IK]MCU4187259.1 polysaccharide biosynthesis protein [Acidiferrimicrobium sp. IK]